MNSVILAMTKCRHKEIKDFLFPGDGLEAAAILVCKSRAWIELSKVDCCGIFVSALRNDL